MDLPLEYHEYLPDPLIFTQQIWTTDKIYYQWICWYTADGYAYLVKKNMYEQSICLPVELRRYSS